MPTSMTSISSRFQILGCDRDSFELEEFIETYIERDLPNISRQQTADKKVDENGGKKGRELTPWNTKPTPTT